MSGGFGQYYGSEPSEYQYVQKTETFLEEQYQKFSGTDKLGVLNIVALISLAFGVESGWIKGPRMAATKEIIIIQAPKTAALFRLNLCHAMDDSDLDFLLLLQ